MTKPTRIVAALIIGLAAVAGLNAQGAKTTHYDKNGLAFDYPTGWAMQESPAGNGQNIKFVPPNSDLQISVFEHNLTIETPEKTAQMKEKVIDVTVESYTKLMNGMGMKPTRTEGRSAIGGVGGDAIHLRGSLDGNDGEAGIYWVTLNNRLIVVSLFGPDEDLKRFAGALEALRASITVAPAAPAATPPK